MTTQHTRETEQTAKNLQSITKNIFIRPYYEDEAHPHLPCEKPLELLCNFIALSSREDGIVLDPFMGSGSTLVAAKQMGRKAIGIKKEEAYCGLAVGRWCMCNNYVANTFIFM